MAFLISYVVFCVLVWSLWIKKLLISSNTDTQTQRFAVEYQQIISHPEVSSTTGSRNQRSVVETRIFTENRFIQKVEERNDAVLKNHALASELKLLEDQLVASNLKLQQLQNVHDEFVLQHEIRLESNQRVICQLEEKCLRLEYNDSRLRRKIEERDRLLASKEKDFADQIARQKKVNNNLLTQLIGMLDNLGEETVQQLAEAKKKTETRDVGCGSDDEPIQPQISVLEPPQIVNEQQTTVPVIPVEMAIPDEPENVSSSLPETEVRPAIDGGERDDESSFVKEVPVSQPEIVAGQFQPSEAPPPVLPPATEYVVRSDIMHFTTDYSITVRGIPTGQIGLVIGHRGRNMLRLERGYGVGLRFVEGTLYITGGDQRRRQDALKDVVENLPIVLECPFLPLEDHERINNLLINGLSFEYNVTICRPSARNKTGTISGRIDRCKTVYHLLKKASSPG
jgi:hypothetical protein